METAHQCGQTGYTETAYNSGNTEKISNMANLIKIATKLSTDFSKRAILFLIYLPADKGKYVLGKIRILEY